MVVTALKTKLRLALLFLGSFAFTPPACDALEPPVSSSNAATGNSGVAAKQTAPRVIASNLPAMLKGLKHAGWDLVGQETYQIEGVKLFLTSRLEPGKSADQPAEAVALSLPVSGNETAILDEFSCIALGQKVFKRGNRFITVKAFEFAKSDGANAGYDLLRKGSTTVVKRGDGSSEDADNISFWQDKFLFVLSGTSEDDDESKEVITKFAQNLSTLAITHAQPPAILSRLPVIDRVKGSEKIVMGPVSASRYFPAPELGALLIDEARAAAVADYQMLQPARERMKLLYVDYGDAGKAQTAFNAFSDSLSQLHEPEKNQEAGKLLFKLNKTFLMCQLRQPGKLIVITGARKSKSPIILARQILDR